MRLIDTLSKEELRELLGKCWMTHDGMWFAHTFFSQGIEAANRMNKAAIHGLAAVEVSRFLKTMGLKKKSLNSYDRLRDFFMNISDLVIPGFMNVEIDFPEKDRITWRFNDRGCFAWHGVSMLKIIDAYECGPLYRIRCWLDALEIEYEMTPDVHLCQMNQSDTCRGRIWIKRYP